MKARFTFAKLALVLVLALSLGSGTAKAITWGEVDDDELFPNVGTIMIQFSSGPDYFQLCSGTLIHPLVFLTAGHCVAALDFYRDLGLLTDVKVSFAVDPSDDSTYLAVDEALLHPDYWTAPPSRRHWPDVGALTLTLPVVGIPPPRGRRRGLPRRTQVRSPPESEDQDLDRGLWVASRVASADRNLSAAVEAFRVLGVPRAVEILAPGLSKPGSRQRRHGLW